MTLMRDGLQVPVMHGPQCVGYNPWAADPVEEPKIAVPCTCCSAQPNPTTEKTRGTPLRTQDSVCPCSVPDARGDARVCVCVSMQRPRGEG